MRNFVYWIFCFLSAAIVSMNSLCAQMASPQTNAASGKQTQDVPLVSEKSRRALRNLVDDVARLGLAAEVQALQDILVELGDSPEDHLKLQKTWERELQRSKNRGNERARKSLAQKITKVAHSLEGQLEGLEDNRKQRLAWAILALDDSSESCNVLLGRKFHEGYWMDERAIQIAAGTERVTELLQQARRLEVVVEHGSSQAPQILDIYGDSSHMVSAHGVHLYGGVPAAKLERILRESLRAIALSNALLFGPLEIPKLDNELHIVVLNGEEDYAVALEQARDNGRLSDTDYKNQLKLKQGGFFDNKGWFTARWALESRSQATVIWYYYYEWIGHGIQPCFFAGHLNWICLNFFGTSMPNVLWGDAKPSDSGTAVAQRPREDALWRSTSQSLYGCRMWMEERVRTGVRFPFSLTVVDRLGKVNGESLLKVTLMNEYLQATGELSALFLETRDPEGKMENANQRITSIEGILGRTLNTLDQEWTSWLLNEDINPGIVQRLSPVDSSDNPIIGKQAMELLGRLADIREQAFSSLGFYVETIEVFPSLSEQAWKHANYLTLNPKQSTLWPDVHEEYADHEGFTPEGAWAGNHSVIYSSTDPAACLEAWMGTFYHRLPLLNPGLFGIGYGIAGKTAVLDVESLIASFWSEAWVVWPAKDSQSVPLSFQPELPNPIPGEAQDFWGYPITLQAYWGDKEGEFTIEMELHEGGSVSGPIVACYFLTPANPYNSQLVPKDAYCLIPKAHLRKGSTYTVLARCPETGQEQSWSFRTGR